MEEYSRMDLMRMTDEDLRKLLKEEGEKLPTFTVLMIVEELKRREETPESAYEEIDDEVNEVEDASEDNDEEDADADPEEEKEETEEDGEKEDLTPEERLQNEIETVEKLKKERTKMLVIASVAAVSAALLIVGFMLYLYFSGQM